MIQKYLKNQAKQVAPDFEWSVDYYTGEDNTVMVQYEGGPVSDIDNETDWRFPQYMFYIRSSDWDRTKTIAYRLYDLFHKKKVDELINVPELDKTYRVYFMQAMSEPNRLGVGEDKVMEYSLNIQVQLREEI